MMSAESVVSVAISNDFIQIEFMMNNNIITTII